MNLNDARVHLDGILVDGYSFIRRVKEVTGSSKATTTAASLETDMLKHTVENLKQTNVLDGEAEQIGKRNSRPRYFRAFRPFLRDAFYFLYIMPS